MPFHGRHRYQIGSSVCESSLRFASKLSRLQEKPKDENGFRNKNRDFTTPDWALSRLTDHKGNDKYDAMDLDFHALMKEALREAQEGFARGEVPVGAVLVGPDGTRMAKAHNMPITLNDPTAHAEVLALRAGGMFSENYRLCDATLVVTLEPCLMCMGAALNARIFRLVFGAFDTKSGAAGSLYDVAGDGRLNHRIEVLPGIMEKECSQLMQDFFHLRRGENRTVRRGTEVVVTGSTRNRLVPLEAGHVGSNPTLSAKKSTCG
jgi:tRNA(adenine34) deaminase